MTLDELVRTSAAREPGAIAVVGPDSTLSYGELDALANRLARGLSQLGVVAGDRVGLWLEKSAEAVAAMQGVLRLGAAYVPLDPFNPPARVVKIVEDCAMRVVVADSRRAGELRQALPCGPKLLTLDGDAFELGPAGLAALSPSSVPPSPVGEKDLAYILYTSGSTGTPKGVCISHLNALAFIRWGEEVLAPVPADRFANHAPFFFDLSVLDLYVAFAAGASVHLVPEGLAYAPARLVDFVRRQAISVWYSVPSALILMMEQGRLIEEGAPSVRAFLFAGEPFPMKQLRVLRRAFADRRFLNLYGPTETNVCTFYEVGALSDDAMEPLPIGKACCGDRAWIDAAPGAAGAEGELLVEGPTVMLGYWGKPPQGSAPYRTGDIVRELPDGGFIYVGRRDSLVKVRGRRIELGEIETALMEMAAVREAAVRVEGEGTAARLVAYLSTADGARPGLLEVKRHCAERLPRYMIVDALHVLPALPRTRNGKVDRRALGAFEERG